MMITFSFLLWHVIVPACLFTFAYMVENTFWKWKFYKPFSFWRALILQKLSKFGAKIINLKRIYIFFAVIIGFALLILFIALYSQLSYIISGNVKTTISTIDSNFALAFLGTVSGGVALFTGYMAILRSGTNERETRTAEEGLITERLTKATEGLGKKDGKKDVVEVRLGAIYALERIAQDSLRDHVQIMEILCAYVRHNSPRKSKNSPVASLREDLKAIMTIIGRRGQGKGGVERIKLEKKQRYAIDLSYCNLQNSILNDDIILRGSWLQESDLTGSMLLNADLEDSWLQNTNLTDVWIERSDLTDAGFRGTIMRGTKTKGAFAYKGKFIDCKYITQKQFDQMFCGIDVDITKASKTKKFKRPAHWPNKKLSYDDFMNKYYTWLYAQE